MSIRVASLLLTIIRGADNQVPYQTYPGNNYAKLKAVEGKYGLKGFSATRTGGFKYT
jgi:hypothetical protein